MTSALDILNEIAHVMATFEIFYDFQSITAILIAGVGTSIGVVFVWWSVRRVTAIIMNAFRRGRLKM